VIGFIDGNLAAEDDEGLQVESDGGHFIIWSTAEEEGF
jgi:hypothetical protein